MNHTATGKKLRDTNDEQRGTNKLLNQDK